MDERLPPEGVLVGERYRVGPRLGSGAMGVVLEAEDVVLGRRVAIKLLSQALHEDPALARFEREARAVAKLNDPNVVSVSDFVRDPAWGPAIVLELLVGESLAVRLSRRPPPSESELVDIAVQALAALEHAHAAGVIHRDLKPSNLFLVTLSNGLVVTKLLDFGVAKLLDDGGAAKLTAAGVTIGTPSYMPLEQALGGTVDARVDVYAVGALLYEALSGAPPYEGEPMHVIGAILGGPPEPLARVAPHVSPELEAIVTRAMARLPADRFASAAEMRATLRRVRLQPRRTATSAIRERLETESEAPTIVSPPSLPLEPSPRGRRLALTLAIAAISIGVMMWSLRPSPVPAPAPSLVPQRVAGAPPPPSSVVTPRGIDPPPALPPPPTTTTATTRATHRPHPTRLAEPPASIVSPPAVSPPITSPSRFDAPMDPFASSG